MKKIFKYSMFFMSFIFILNACKKNDTPQVQTPVDTFSLPTKEMRAPWVATVYGLDWPQSVYNADAQKKQYTDYLDEFKALNMNAVFVQVRGMGDAFYNSPYEPWSASITGQRGKDPGYDVLKFMIDEAHARGLEFHAWLNPYRIATRSADTIPYPALHSSIDSSWVISHQKIQIYNPAVPEVRQRLVDVVKDIITKYDVDGIHFDDYFYPDPSAAGTMVADAPDYEKYNNGEYSTIQNFRRGNVDKAIKAVHDAIVATKPQVVFSISPASDNNYNLNTLYANVTKWTQEGWLDVVIPQLYHDNTFQERLGWWAQYSYKAALMVGHGLYRFGDTTAPAAFQSNVELQRQFNVIKAFNSKDYHKPSVGNLQYSAKYITLNKVGVKDKLAEIYANPGVIPFLGRAVAPAPATPENVRIEGNTLKWSTSGSVRSVVYYTPDLQTEAKVLTITNATEYAANNSGYYTVTTLNVDNMESKAAKEVKK